LIILLLNSCNDNTVDVKPIKSLFEYTWTSDTLYLEGSLQIVLTSLWGSSDKDLYIVGSSASSKGVMWHYDGLKWLNVKLNFVEGGPIKGPFDLYQIIGFSSTNIWAVGATLRDNPNPPPDILGSSLIIHFDGAQWNTIEHQNGDRLINVAGVNNNLWAGGDGVTMFHFNGTIWERDSVGFNNDTMSIKDRKNFVIHGVGTDGINTLALGTYYNENIPQRIYYFFRKYDNWVVADSFIYKYRFDDEIKWGPNLYITQSGKVYSYGMGGVFTWDGNSWERIFRYDDIWNIFVKENGEMFVMIGGGKVFYYDGVNWKEIDALNNPDIIYTCAWATESEAFIAGITTGGFPQKTVIFHGK
jgi:hypothetical protein